MSANVRDIQPNAHCSAGTPVCALRHCFEKLVFDTFMPVIIYPGGRETSSGHVGDHLRVNEHIHVLQLLITPKPTWHYNLEIGDDCSREWHGEYIDGQARAQNRLSIQRLGGSTGVLLLLCR